jgi:hypothetical protein
MPLIPILDCCTHLKKPTDDESSLYFDDDIDGRNSLDDILEDVKDFSTDGGKCPRNKIGIMHFRENGCLVYQADQNDTTMEEDLVFKSLFLTNWTVFAD